MAVELHHLGTGHAFPDPLRGPTATLLRSHDRTVLVDAGSGTLQKLHAAGAHLLSLDALVLTHAHLDHIADVAPMLFALAVPVYRRSAPLTVYASSATLAYLDGLRTVFGKWVTPPDDAVQFVRVDVGQRLDIAGFDVRTYAVSHHESSVGFRFEAPCGASIAIPGDTGPAPGLAEAIAGVDYAILECSLPDAVAFAEHLNPSGFVELVANARPREVAVVHRYPLASGDDVTEALSRAPVPVRFVNDGDHVVVTSGR